MIIKTIEASGSDESMQPTGLKKWRGFRMLADINETENEIECALELKKKLESILKMDDPLIDRIPDRVMYSTPTPPPVIDRRAIERLEILIDDCATMDELVKYKDQVGSLGLIDMYHAKFDQLMRVDAENKLIQNQSMG